MHKEGKNHSRKAMLKKILNKDGASSTKMDNGLGNMPLQPGSGGGTNMGVRGVF